VIRCSISGVLRPVYCHITETTGMLISGKMSVGMLTIVVMPRKSMRLAIT
jgi:hypothetical protein